MAELRSSASTTKHSGLFKASSPAWKESYKRRCAERLKGSRAKLLERYRDVENLNDANNLSSSVVDGVMRDEWKSVQTADHSSEVLDVMKQIRLELMLQEREILLQYDRMRDLDEKEFHDCVNEHDKALQNLTQVVCPVCRTNYLEKQMNIIGCRCGMQVNTEQDCISLQHVDVQLRVGVTAHAENCNARPVFGVISGFGPQNLLMSCNSCDFMFVVI